MPGITLYFAIKIYLLLTETNSSQLDYIVSLSGFKFQGAISTSFTEIVSAKNVCFTKLHWKENIINISMTYTINKFHLFLSQTIIKLILVDLLEILSFTVLKSAGANLNFFMQRIFEHRFVKNYWAEPFKTPF